MLETAGVGMIIMPVQMVTAFLSRYMYRSIERSTLQQVDFPFKVKKNESSSQNFTTLIPASARQMFGVRIGGGGKGGEGE